MKRNQLKTILLLLVCLCGVESMHSQGSFDIFGGYGTDVRAGLNYNLFFSSKQWGVSTGLEVGRWQQTYSRDQINLQYDIAVPNGLPLDSRFTFHAFLSGYDEKQYYTTLNIPIMVCFQTESKHAFYVRAGLKVGLPMSSYSNARATSVQTKAYSDYTNQWYEDIPERGFSSYHNVKSKDDLKINVAYMAALELGVRWYSRSAISIYTGVYLDWGLNDLRKDNTFVPLLAYNETRPQEYHLGSALYSQWEGHSDTDKLQNLSLGIKVGVSFGKKAKKKETFLPSAPEVQPPPQHDSKPVSTPDSEQLAYEYRLLTLSQPVNYYEKDQWEPDRTQLSILEEKVAILLRYPHLCVTLEAYVPDSEVASGLGRKRIEAISEYLITRGISASRLQMGNEVHTYPSAPDDDEDVLKKNRRVEVNTCQR